MRNSGAIYFIKGNNFAYWSNFKIEIDVELQIQKFLEFEFDMNFIGFKTF
jgi:hypothetical protein